MFSNTGRKEALKAKILVGKLKDRVGELSATSSSTTKSISKLKTMVAASKKAENPASIKISAMKK